jgi:hypothetical protein
LRKDGRFASGAWFDEAEAEQPAEKQKADDARIHGFKTDDVDQRAKG